MEIRARYFLVGMFVLAALAGGAGFLYWLLGAGGFGERTIYEVRFTGSVSGLSAGSEVVFNGVPVGEVLGLSLDPGKPGDVVVRVAVDKAAPVRTDTRAGLSFSGLTGAAKVALTGGEPVAAAIVAPPGGRPVLVADNEALKDITEAARGTLAEVDRVIAENQQALKSAISSIDTFAQALARNADKVDSIIAGLQGLTGGGPSKPAPAMFVLDAPATFPAGLKFPKGQLRVVRPSALLGLDTQRLLLASAGGDVPVFEDIRWIDSLPAVVQSATIRAFENAGYPRVVDDSGNDPEDFQLRLDLRAFHITAMPAGAEVAFAAKVLDATGRVVDSRAFSATDPVSSVDDATAALAGLEGAFAKAEADLVTWTLDVANRIEAATPDQAR